MSSAKRERPVKTVEVPQEAQPSEFFVAAAASLTERRPRALKHGDTFAVLDQHGDMIAGTWSADGLYHKDTRYLSHCELLVEGQRPVLLSSTLRDDNAAFVCDLTNPDIYRGAQLVLPHDTIHLRRTKFVWDQRCFERLLVRNFTGSAQQVTIEYRFEADFKDLFEVRGMRRARHGRFHPIRSDAVSVVISYTGLDGIERATHLRFDPTPQQLVGNAAQFTIALPPGGHKLIFVETAMGRVDVVRPPPLTYLGSVRRARRALQRTSSRAAAIASSNSIFNEALCRSVADIAMLVTDMETGPYPYAGIPWFSAPFGRDAIITALELMWMDSAIARGVLRFLAAHQAQDEDPSADAQPGKILHEMRHGEMARLGEVPFGRYYGSVDSTPLFLMLADAYLTRTGDLATIRQLWPHLDAALRWIDDYGDADKDGFVEYGRQRPDGLINQGWKDSHDSIFHADGSLARGPIALCEVQGYVYAAKRGLARIAAALGEEARATRLAQEAEALQQAFDAAFWDERLATYALALDGEKRPCAVRTSNAGHALFSGIALPQRARQLADTLMNSFSFSGWGIRTAASTEARYNPMSYHNGSVWPHDSALIAAGLARYGFKEEAARIFEGLFAASVYIDLRRLPELLCGFPRRHGQGPTFYPVACSPQAWAAGAHILLIEACLGMSFDTQAGVLRLERPILPSFVDELSLRRIRLGESEIDLVVRRASGDVAISKLEIRGTARVAVTY